MNKTFRQLFMPTGLLAAILLLALPGMAVNCDKNPSHPSCSGGGTQGATYTVAVKADPLWSPGPTTPTYAPACAAETPGANSYAALFPRHDLCATVTTSTGAQLTDDIVIRVPSHQGLLTAVQLAGQDVIGEEGIAHESEQVPLLPPLEPSPTGFTIHVHADNVPVWKLSRHTGGKRVEIIGYVSIADLVYVPK
jgi:hypothetical protein